MAWNYSFMIPPEKDEYYSYFYRFPFNHLFVHIYGIYFKNLVSSLFAQFMNNLPYTYKSF